MPRASRQQDLRNRNVGSGFSLVELLVVIGIIALLLAILLPVVSRVRRAAQCAACLSNLRGIGQAMMMYAAQYDGAIAGSGLTSGRHLWTASGSYCVPANGYSIDNCPLVNEPCDYIGPLARMMGVVVPEIFGNDGRARFALYQRLAQFRCPSYEGIMAHADASGADVGPVQAPSYNTAMAFLNVSWNTYPYNARNGFAGTVTTPPDQPNSGAFWTMPPGYFPRVDKVGNPAAKIYAADGARRLVYATPPKPAELVGPTYVLQTDPQLVKWSDTMFSDYGAFTGMSQSYHREAVPGNAKESDPYLADGRILAYRHGTAASFRPAGEYLMNAVFFDGHAETLDDLAASNPNLWLPRGTIFWNPTHGATGTVRAGLKVLWADYCQKFYPGKWGTGSSFVIQ